jgi:uncharacterized cupin superfamily protein
MGMASYTRLNLREVEDMAPKFGYAPDMESRFARRALGLQNSGLSLFRLVPGFRVPFGHSHSEQEEVYVVLSGGLRVNVTGEIVELGPLDALRVPPGTARGMEAGPDGAEYLAFGAPSTESPDAEMLPDFWTD